MQSNHKFFRRAAAAFSLMTITSICACSPLLAQSGKKTEAAAESSQLVEEFTQIYRAWDAALVKVDLKTLDSMYAEELRLTSPDGSVSSKRSALADLESGRDVISAASTDDFKVMRYGDTAIVTCRWTAKETLKDQDVSGQSRWTDVWIKRSGRWKILASHGCETSETDAEVVQHIAQLRKEWDAARVRGDTGAINRILGDDYVATASDGMVEAKANLLSKLKSGHLTFGAATTDQLKISVYRSNTAVVTGRWIASGISKGKEWSGAHRFTETWVRRNGGWQIVASQTSKIGG